MDSEIKQVVGQLGDAFEEFKTTHVARVDELEKRLNRPAFGTTATEKPQPPEQWRDAKSGAPIPVLRHGQSLAALEKRSDADISVGRFLRGIVLGNRADDARELAEERKALAINDSVAGGYTVGGALSAQWIDLLRANLVLSQAGALTVPMDAKSLSVARLVSDPTVTWHGENAALPDSDPTFGLATLSAKTATCLVKLSLELSQDSVNIEQILQSTMVAAFANAVDSAGLNGVAVNAAAAPAGIFNLTGRNTVTSIGAPTTWDWVVDGMYELLADNVPQANIGALIAHPAVWKKMRKLKTGISSDNTPLIAPPEVAALPKLWTTAAPLTGGTTAKAIMGNWSDLLFGVRKGLEVRVLTETFLGSNLQVALLGYVRCDFVAVRPESFVTLEGLTV